MATGSVIDELVVNLQLNVENFNQRLRQIEDNLTRTRNLTEDNARRVNSANESMADGFLTLAGKAGKVIAGLVAGNAIKNFTVGMIQSGEALYNFSLRTGQTIKDVAVLKNALENLGLSAESGLSELNNLVSSAAKLQMGLPGYEQAARFASLGISLRDKDGNIKSGEEILRSVNKWLAQTEGIGDDPATAARKTQKLQYLGLSSFDLLLRKSPKEFDEYLAKHRQFQDQAEQQAKTSATLANSARDFKKALTATSDNISVFVNKFFSALMDGLTLFLDWLPGIGGNLSSAEKRKIRRRGRQSIYELSGGKIDLRSDKDKWVAYTQEKKDLEAKHKRIISGSQVGSISEKDKEEARKTKKQIQQRQQKQQRQQNLNDVGVFGLIGQLESRSDYNTMAGGGNKKQLTSMTINEVLQYQNSRGTNMKAAGKWQIMPNTLRGLKKSMNLTGEELFTPEMQDRMAFELAMNRKGYRQFANATGAEKLALMGAAQNDLAKEWASMPMSNDAEGMHRLKQLRSKFQQDLTKGAKVSKRGRQIANMSDAELQTLLNSGASYYEGIATNKALTSRANAERVLMQGNHSNSFVAQQQQQGNSIHINNVNVTTDTSNAENVARGMKSAINSQFAKGLV